MQTVAIPTDTLLQTIHTLRWWLENGLAYAGEDFSLPTRHDIQSLITLQASYEAATGRKLARPGGLLEQALLEEEAA